jgi:hypothetical protein
MDQLPSTALPQLKLRCKASKDWRDIPPHHGSMLPLGLLGYAKVILWLAGNMGA